MTLFFPFDPDHLSTNTLLVIVGPTGVGKTEFALRLCEELAAAGRTGEIVSADSRQIYRGMDIGTAKPTPAERARVRHHLIDVVNPDEPFTLAEYQEQAYAAIDAIFARGNQPLLVGGTGLYVRAIVQGLQIPRVPPDPARRQELARRPTPELYAELKRLDPEAAEKILPNNKRRIIRALEVIAATGKPISQQQKRQPPPYSIVQSGLTLPRPVLYARVDRRIEQMIERGLVDEVRGLVAQGYGFNLPSMTGLGYREIGMYLRGEVSLEEAVALLKRNTRKFIRHQANWFRGTDPQIHWINLEETEQVSKTFRVLVQTFGVTPRRSALEIYRAALRAADPRAAVHRVLRRERQTLYLNDEPIYELGRGRTIVIGAGKAGAPMAQAVEQVLGDALTAGAVIVKYGHTAPTRAVTLYEAGHPLPDENGVRATEKLVALLNGLTQNDLVLCLVSGGGSALLELPVAGVTLDDQRALTDALLRCGAVIGEINALRKHLSQVKGGQLARRAQPARVVSLILSDVLGSPLDVIASGPTAPDPTTFRDALKVIDKYSLRDQVPASILAHLERGARGELPDTPKLGDPLFARVTNVVIADNALACQAAAEEARARGYAVTVVSTHIEGEAREVGVALARRALAERNLAEKRCWIAGGEPTVTLRGSGKGGRAQELALAAARELDGAGNILLLAAGTDGTDGPTDAAGALADGTTLARARALGLDADRFLENNDAYHFFEALGDLIITGPTNTNVNDLMVVLAE